MSWKPRIAEEPDTEAASLREMGWEEAQSLANFILMKPEALPKGSHLVAPTMRPEAPPGRKTGSEAAGRPVWTISNRSCHRFEVVNASGRIRAKQFLYDWAPPAFDHPSLWRDRPKAFPLQQEICWVGRNYLKQHGASLHRARTMIELSVLSGTFADEELVELCDSFRPIDDRAVKEIGNTPLADLCYQARHSECPIVVPTGYWAHQRDDQKKPGSVFPAATIPSAARLQKIAPAGHLLDSAFLYEDASSEADYVFTAATDKNDYVRLLTWESANRFDETHPPALDEQPCSTNVLTVAGQPVFHAYLTGIGPHEAFWQQGSNCFLCLTKPTPTSGMAEFVALLDHLVRAVAEDTSFRQDR